jgi:hypothetical protein
MKYRKKPLIIEAVKWDGNPDTLDCFAPNKDRILTDRDMDVAGIHQIRPQALYLDEKKRLQIATLEGHLWCDVGNWIVRGIAGEFYPVRDDIFITTYEKEDEA